jgi:TorA maturation chaperone TorD
VDFNMRDGFLFPLVARLWAAELVSAAYVGILGRPPDEPGLRARCAELGWPRSKSASNLAEILAAMSHSPERWKRSLEQRADELVRGVFGAILQREPLEKELRTLAAQLRKSGDLYALVASVATSQESWERLLEARSEELVLRLYRLVFGRDPASGLLKGYSARLKESKDLSCLLAAIGSSQEFWELQVARRAGDLVRAVYRCLLKREPEDAALKAYAEQLKEHKSLEQILESLARSEELGNVVQRDGAEKLVRTIFASLLNREPEEAALKSYAANIRQGQSLGEVLSAVGRS